MTNVAVARFLLNAGLPQVDGCVVFDHRGRKVVVMRSSKRAVPLHRCGLKRERLFTFFDQVCCRAVTLWPCSACNFHPVCVGLGRCTRLARTSNSRSRVSRLSR